MKARRLNDLKRHVFFELLETVGRAFLVIRYSERVRIGRRGFLPEEKEQGLILVINRQMNLRWEEGVIRCRLVFGQTPEDCLIPEEFVIGVNSPETKTQFLCFADTSPKETHRPPKPRKAPKPRPTAAKKSGPSKVVSVDFTKKKK